MRNIETLGDIKKLIEDKVESKFLEFKEEIDKPEKIVKEVTAFANADGGELVIGIREDKGCG